MAGSAESKVLPVFARPSSHLACGVVVRVALTADGGQQVASETFSPLVTDSSYSVMDAAARGWYTRFVSVGSRAASRCRSRPGTGAPTILIEGAHSVAARPILTSSGAVPLRVGRAPTKQLCRFSCAMPQNRRRRHPQPSRKRRAVGKGATRGFCYRSLGPESEGELWRLGAPREECR